MSHPAIRRRRRGWTPLLASAALLVLVILFMPAAMSLFTGADFAQQALAQRADAPRLVVYSGRTEPLIEPIIQRFRAETGIDVVVRYGDTAQLAATIIEEGGRSPADVFFAQDAGALGALSEAGLLSVLPDQLLALVDGRLNSPKGQWIATSGRARVIVHNTDVVPANAAPTSIWELVEPQWRGRVGWAPTNGSFQAFVTALRVLEGDDKAAEWLRGVSANSPRVYPNNRAIVDAVIRGEVHIGLVNHYYLFQFIDQHGDELPARNHYTAGDAGAMVNVSGVGVLNSSVHKETALQFIEFLLSEPTQQYFTDNNFEYPVIIDAAVRTNELLLPLAELDVPELDLGNIQDLEGTLELMQRVGVL